VFKHDDNAVKSFDILATSSSVIHKHYFDGSKVFSIKTSQRCRLKINKKFFALRVRCETFNSNFHMRFGYT